MIISKLWLALKWICFVFGGIILFIVIAGAAIHFYTAEVMTSSQKKMSAFHPFRSKEAKDRYLKLYDKRAREWPVASECRMVDTSYGQTFVRICGPVDAPPLALLHGIGGNSLQWIPNIRDLSEHYRIYAVDNIYDYGRSIYTQTPKTPDDFVKWLDECFNALGLQKNINLMGLSYGGWITALYALHYPDRLNGIVLLAPVCTVLPLHTEWIVRAALCAVPHVYFVRSFMYWMLEDLVRKDEAGRKMVDEWAHDSFIAMRCFKPKRLVHPTVLEDEELGNLKVPTLYLVGENEKICSAHKALLRLKNVAPQVKAEIIPNAGHDLTIVQADIVNRKILSFLKQ